MTHRYLRGRGHRSSTAVRPLHTGASGGPLVGPDPRPARTRSVGRLCRDLLDSHAGARRYRHPPLGEPHVRRAEQRVRDPIRRLREARRPGVTARTQLPCSTLHRPSAVLRPRHCSEPAARAHPRSRPSHTPPAKASRRPTRRALPGPAVSNQLPVSQFPSSGASGRGSSPRIRSRPWSSHHRPDSSYRDLRCRGVPRGSRPPRTSTGTGPL